jgi:hypothetical protein
MPNVESFLSQFSKVSTISNPHSKFNRKLSEFREFPYHTLPIHAGHVTYHIYRSYCISRISRILVSHISHHISRITYHTSHITHYIFTHHTPHITHHTSHITYTHIQVISNITCTPVPILSRVAKCLEIWADRRHDSHIGDMTHT